MPFDQFHRFPIPDVAQHREVSHATAVGKQPSLPLPQPDGDVAQWLAVLPLWVLVTLATAWLQPEIYTNLLGRPWSLGFVLLMLGGLYGVFRFLRQGRELAAFLSSCSFLLGLLATTMTGSYPIWLRSTVDPADSLTAANTAAESYAMQVALVCLSIAIALAGGYFEYLFRSVRGKVDSGAEEHGY